jgi:eukaryotic-like serine/threonine-protein kinase
MIGTQIENYLVQAQLGEGGMGTVYRALETNLDRTVAIKVLNTDLARDPSIVERFRSEARAQANLNHTNIATLYAFLVFQGNPVMVMEYVEGDTFQQLVNRRGPLPSEEAIPLFRQALLGISAAHRMGIVHRDIKPSNLMLNRAGIVKVMDFGIAKVASSVNNLTRTGAQMGTVFYMSPEQVKGERVDIRSDIYSLGITLYELLTANVPFSASSEFQVLNDHVNTPPPPPSKFYPYLAKGLENIILKSLAKNPDERFQTAEEFGAALERPEAWEAHTPATNTPLHATVLAGGRTNVTPPPAPVSIPSPAASPMPAAALAPSMLAPATPMPRKAIAAAVIILGLAGGGAYLYSRGKAPSPSSRPGVVSSGNTARPSGQLGEPTPSTDQLKPIASDASDTDSSAPADSTLAARNAAAAASAVHPARQPVKPRETPARHDTANPPSPPPDVAVAPPPNVQTPAPAKPVASPAELDEAHQRFVRLRSKALALKSSLAELRQRLASQGLSVNSEAVEAEGNMDSYMLEADRALQAGDVQTTGSNLDRAEHEIKKISALFGR